MKEANELGRCGCGKDLAQHSHEDFKACALRFGGTITEDGGGYIFLQSVAPERPESRAEFMASECCICNSIRRTEKQPLPTEQPPPSVDPFLSAARSEGFKSEFYPLPKPPRCRKFEPGTKASKVGLHCVELVPVAEPEQQISPHP